MQVIATLTNTYRNKNPFAQAIFESSAMATNEFSCDIQSSVVYSLFVQAISSFFMACHAAIKGPSPYSIHVVHDS